MTGPGMRFDGGGGKTLKVRWERFKAITLKVLAWAAFLIGFAASPLLAATFVGGAVDKSISFVANLAGDIVDWFPGNVGDDVAAAVPLLLLTAMVVSTAVDVFRDGIPNQVALYCAVASAPVARSVKGDFGAWVERFGNNMLNPVRDDLTGLAGTASAFAIGSAVVLAAIIVARRTMAAKSSAAR